MIAGRLTYCYCVFLLVIVVSFFSCNQKISKEQDHEDKVSLWLHQTQNDNHSLTKRKFYLDSAYTYANTLTNDSIKKSYLATIAYRAFQLKDSVLFMAANQKTLDLATSYGDNTVKADAHWNYGAFYLQKECYDSAYYHYNEALNLYQRIPAPYYTGKMLYNMAIVHSRIKDYTACEVLLFQAITILEPLKKHKQLYYCYNLLGIVYYELNEPERSIEYYTMAMNNLRKIGCTELLNAHLNNNLGILFQDQKQYDRSLFYFDNALRMLDLKTTDPALYARLKDNVAYTRLLMKDPTINENDFYPALYLRDSLNKQTGVVTSMLHLAAYFAFKKNTERAISLAKEALQKARKIKNNSETLKSLKFLSKVDPSSKSSYLEEFSILTERIHNHERKVRNKFARVRYETNKYIERTKTLTTQRLWIISVSVVVFILLATTYFYYREIARNRMLHLENQQQHIRNKLLYQENQKHKALQKERERISKVLHGKILGDMAGFRISWFRLPLTGPPEIMQEHKENIEKLREYEQQIRDASHKLHKMASAIENNFIEEIEKLIQTRCNTINLKYYLNNDSGIPWKAVPLMIKNHLYNIIEEGVRNCIIHAQAKHLKVCLSYREPEIHLTMADDGKGIKKQETTHGIGLSHIESNVKELNGRFVIESKPGKGTILHIRIPLTKI
ncbi:tetratricopeptide repeat-containing sensor histidine kinase [Galbibacter pacificus]|uniref:histidine kinase n=1 Tax=Galbibacter pacificus TaxID=2996052 RepID=A0ABT6FN75_9FLAO|nr:tetratricopeptide repeat-containing sensor histidine kinase [Galbibacter pacificus]MDG3581237.1 tetratricopeptide repeat protein [Galbibacter pacificus]MDG3584715.1 tetratricopeptide repeat protein [Galbibacter pacificus]